MTPAEVVSKKHMEEKAVKSKIFLTILQNVRFLACQSLPVRNLSDIGIIFLQLLKQYETKSDVV